MSYRNKSSVEYEKELPFLIQRDGRCCTKKNGNGCGRTFDELFAEEERVRRVTGREVKAPLVQIDHINGDSNQRDGPNGEYCGNQQLLCTPCHIRKHVNERARQRIIKIGSATREAPPEMTKNIKCEPDWAAEVINYIFEKKSMCLSLVRYGFDELSDVTTGRYLKKRLVSKDPNVEPLLELGWGRCSSALCNGVHVYYYNTAPRTEEEGKPNLEDP